MVTKPWPTCCLDWQDMPERIRYTILHVEYEPA